MRNITISPGEVEEKNLRLCNIIPKVYGDFSFKDCNLSWSQFINISKFEKIDLTGVDSLCDFDLCGINTSKDTFSYDNKILDADVSKIRADFMSKMLFEGDAIFDLRDKLASGLIHGSAYGIKEKCGCFVRTIANFRKYETESDVKFINVDPESPIELWFRGINIGDTPENNFIAKITMGWIDEFITAFYSLVKKYDAERKSFLPNDLGNAAL